MKTAPSTISHDDRILVISANFGGRGWRMARLSTCYSGVYWYKSEKNGEFPWSFPKDFSCTERLLAPNHFDRHLSDGSVAPIFGERISRFWNNDNWKDRWIEIWNTLDLPEEKLVYVVHDEPKQIREWFPNSTIINLYDYDSKVSANWHLQTSANYRISHHFSDMKPDYRNHLQRTMDWIIDIKGSEAKFKDIWLCETHGVLEWNDELYEEYKQHEYQFVDEENWMRYDQREWADFTTTWDEFHPNQLKPFLGELDDNHTSVLGNSKF